MELIVKPIGYFKCQQTYPAESPRQPFYSHTSNGVIELDPQNNFEQGLLQLAGFSHIWVHFWFHHNTHWTPLTQPPRFDQEKIGVFASRAPYRPNPIGLSCLPIISIKGLSIYVGPHDLLNKTPILDIKPYIADYDSHPTATNGWLRPEERFDISWSELAQKQATWIELHTTLSVFGFVESQLHYSPLNDRQKRLKKLHDQVYVISHRTWRIQFELLNASVDEISGDISSETTEKNQRLVIKKIHSGYSKTELSQHNLDPYLDKQIHRDFGKDFAAPTD